jgi:3-vinyl bacteriochlorophyllide hydratase
MRWHLPLPIADNEEIVWPMPGRITTLNQPIRLYTDAERRRRDASVWTIVQGVLAPLQFIVFAISLVLVCRYLAYGTGADAAAVSVIAKTLILYAIMVTGSLWERDVYGRYLFARPFFWEDVVSMLVIALHTAYLACLFFDLLDTRGQMYVALLAYLAYVVNAAQFLIKFRMARREEQRSRTASFVGVEG